MDFVTITDHDTIAGVLEIADRPDVFISEELTAHFRGEPQAVHVLCYGITPEDHEWLQANSGDVELCAAYMYEREIACALAHPYYTVGAPLTARHRRRLAELFAVWEIRNGARARELNRPAATYIATRDGIGIGGSTITPASTSGAPGPRRPPPRTPAGVPRRTCAPGRVTARGKQGSAAKWAHAAIALAARSLGRRPQTERAAVAAPTLSGVHARWCQRLLREGDARHGADRRRSAPADARCLLRAWLAAVELDHLDERGLIAYMQDDGFSHSDLYRRACRLHERKLRGSRRAWRCEPRPARPRSLAAAEGLFESCIAAIPYAPATAFLANEQRQARRTLGDDGETPRVAILADGIGSTHGVTRTIEEIRQRGVPGFEIEVVGTDPEVDRRLSAVAEIDVPFYPGLRIGVPSLPAAVQTLADGAFDAIHVCSPGPAGIAGALVARALGLPLVGSYHTELHRLRRPALGRAARGRRDGDGASAPSTAPATSSSPPAPPPTMRWPEIGMAPERILALGSRRGHTAL